MKFDVLFHQIEMLRAACEANSSNLIIILSKQLSNNAKLMGMPYVAVLAERIELNVLNNGEKLENFEYLKTIEDLVLVPNGVMFL